MGELKQVIVVREDLKLSRGKLAAQVAHASVEAVLRSNKKLVSSWRSSGMKKIVLAAPDLALLLDLKERAESEDIEFALISDAGRTEVEAGTITCLGIGPDAEGKIDKITKNLKIL